ncbi:MAG TPA: HAMP domain-containing sensor histidine kinase [Candidatus Angelobacter sp.]
MKKPFWNVRTKLLLTLGLVVCPAVALVFFGFQHLESIEKSHTVEAAIQRDFQQMMMIFDKRLSERVYATVDQVRLSFPSPTDKDADEKLDKILAANPWASCAFIYDRSSGVVIRLSARELEDPDAHIRTAEMGHMIQLWFDAEAKPMLSRMQKMEKEGEPPYHPYAEPAAAYPRQTYKPMEFFPIDAAPKDHIAIGGVMFDPDYLQQFLASAVNGIMADIAADPKHDTGPRPAIMLRYKDDAPLAASTGWDGGAAELEHKMEGALPELVMSIRLPGTTIKAINERFFRTSYIILGTLSLLLITGLFFTYRSVTKAMELAKLKSDIVSNVSHELRTPLALIRLYAETLELGRIPDEKKKMEYYRIVRKESERLTALINNILDFSRIEAGKKEYEFRETDLPSLVRETLDSYRYQIDQNGFQYEEHINDDIPPVRVDREAIARSLLNLVNNAIKYSRNEKYLAVNLYRQNGSVKLDVVDHGIGIPCNEQAKIFDKFYRVCDPMQHETKGSGLGLSLVQHIVNAHGGEISVESTPGKGSKFTMTLPLKPEATASGSSEAAASRQTHEVRA